jgi:hypothetical protein
MPRPRKFDSHPQIAIGHLKRSGMLNRQSAKRAFESGGIAFVLSHNNPQHILTITWSRGNQAFKQEILIGNKLLQLGYRYYFQCPITRELTDRLHLIDGRWGSRGAFRGRISASPSRAQRRLERVDQWLNELFGREGFRKVSGKRRTEIIGKLWLEPMITFRHPELSSLFAVEAERSCRPENQQLRCRTGAMSTFGAVSKGADLDLPSVKERLATWLSRREVDNLDPEHAPLTSPLDFLDDYPALDLRSLSRLGFLKSPLAGFTLKWVDLSGKQKASAVVLVDQSTAARPFLLVQPIDGASAVVEHVIELIPKAAGSRAHLRCPRSGQHKDVLFLREGIFASARANRLHHRSQRKST